MGMPVAAMRKTALDTFEEDEICDTVKNLREICDPLRAEGKKVGWLCPPPSLSPHLLGLIVLTLDTPTGGSGSLYPLCLV